MPFELPSHLSHLAQSGKYSDFTLYCEGHEFKLHQAIVCPQSRVIKAALEGNFKEASSKVLHANEFDVTTVQNLIYFLYTGLYRAHAISESADICSKTSDTGESDTSPIPSPGRVDELTESVTSHVRMVTIADYYDIQNLVEIANSKILTILHISPASSIPRILEEALGSTRATALYSTAASTVADRVEDLVDLHDFMDMELPGSFTLEVLSAAGKRIQKLQAQIDSLESLCLNESFRSSLVIDNIDKCLLTLQGTKGCRHCGAEFACYVDKYGKEREPLYRLRCKKCHCRHTPG